MVSLYENGIYLVNGTEIVPEAESGKVKALTGREADKEAARKGTIAYSILEAHNTSDNMEHLKLRFDSMPLFGRLAQPPHHLCGHRADGQGIRYGAVSHSLRTDQLP